MSTTSVPKQDISNSYNRILRSFRDFLKVCTSHRTRIKSYFWTIRSNPSILSLRFILFWFLYFNAGGRDANFRDIKLQGKSNEVNKKSLSSVSLQKEVLKSFFYLCNSRFLCLKFMDIEMINKEILLKLRLPWQRSCFKLLLNTETSALESSGGGPELILVLFLLNGHLCSKLLSVLLK